MHWHAYTYTGGQVPPDREARDPQSATPPNTISQWFRKPQHMRAGTFTDPEEVFAWLDQEVREAPPSALDGKLDYLRASVDRHADAYAGYYSRGQFVVRVALVCPRPGERCPDPPR
ncbi:MULTISPECIES: hypothetical protein [unclassified Streptomyces]|uniref:hypothetical protein n=1 Tax=unclassified Streptomyces TaxID=2593676 RepID=UPI002DD978C0|nr:MULTISPECIES: hypothetical protein [unclassified Streptomyces]WSB76638.1 hypothetical protein OHB04_13140 [Streptomyces sp. NBC_01775]WSS15075.1 hypothetical protein OG533_26715 [Streptomyces sp. NBC_01186]WSS43918.1 hypothetical protein OG220_27530 [Streptomyces sp. NBC_01187]